MKKLLLFCLLIGFSFSLSAQQPVYLNGYSFGSAADEKPWGTQYVNGKLYLTGTFRDSTDLDPTSGIYMLRSAFSGRDMIFVAVYSSDSIIEFGFAIGSSDADLAPEIAVDTRGNIYLAGAFGNPDFDFDPSSAVVNKPGKRFSSRAYLAKYDAQGNFLWANAYGSSLSYFRDIDHNGKDLLVLCGTYQDSLDLSGGQGNPNWAPAYFGDDGFVLTCDTNGVYKNHFTLEGNAQSNVERTCFDHQDSIIIAGVISERADLRPGPDSFYVMGTGFSKDFFIAKYSTDLSHLSWGFATGAKNTEWVQDLAVNKGDSVLVCGGFADTVDFDPGPGTFIINGDNNTDAFAAIYSPFGDLVSASSWGKNQSERAWGVSYTEKGGLLATGNLSGNGYTIEADATGTLWFMEQRKGNTYLQGQRIINKGDGSFYVVVSFIGGFIPANDPTISSIPSRGRNDVAVLRYTTMPVNPSVEVLQSQTMTLYPNPAFDKLYLRFPGVETGELTIIDGQGRLVLLRSFKNGLSEIDIEALSTGFYIVELRSDLKTYQSRFIKR